MLKKLLYLFLLIVSCYCVDVFAEIEDYKIESLLRKYNLVTLGEKENNIPSIYYGGIMNTKSGNINEFGHISGPILVNGDVFGYKTAVRYANTDSGTGSSYVKGKLSNVDLHGDVEDEGFIDFAELYSYLVNEQERLLNNTIILNHKEFLIEKTGIYTLMNTDEEKKEILIDDYSADGFYIINIWIIMKPIFLK